MRQYPVGLCSYRVLQVALELLATMVIIRLLARALDSAQPTEQAGRLASL